MKAKKKKKKIANFFPLMWGLNKCAESRQEGAEDLPSLFPVSAALLGPSDGSWERLSDSSVGGCLSRVGEVLPIYSSWNGFTAHLGMAWNERCSQKALGKSLFYYYSQGTSSCQFQ